jgi:hypothetical protein
MLLDQSASFSAVGGRFGNALKAASLRMKKLGHKTSGSLLYFILKTKIAQKSCYLWHPQSANNIFLITQYVRIVSFPIYYPVSERRLGNDSENDAYSIDNRNQSFCCGERATHMPQPHRPPRQAFNGC